MLGNKKNGWTSYIFITDKKIKTETEDVNYCIPQYISNESDTHNYNKCNNVSAEETNRGMCNRADRFELVVPFNLLR